jgi:hypothetical protein
MTAFVPFLFHCGTNPETPQAVENTVFMAFPAFVPPLEHETVLCRPEKSWHFLCLVLL